MDTPILLAVDGNSLAHRAYHGYEKTGMAMADGTPLWAVYGFLALLAGIAERVSPNGIVVGFDDHTSSVRKARCPQYKAQRLAKDPALYTQMACISALLLELGVEVIVPAGLEADDVVASAARTAEQAGWRCVVATSDRDSFGLISTDTTVLKLNSGLDNSDWFTPELLVSKYGVYPHQYLDYAALRGDSSDNLAGIRGVGERTAARLLGEFGTLDVAIRNEERLVACIGKALAAKILSPEGRVAIARNQDIMALVRELPVSLETAGVPCERALLDSVLSRYELIRLSERLAGVLGERRSEVGRTVGEEDLIEQWGAEAAEADRLAGGQVRLAQQDGLF
jgi:DNA polymerase-1